VRDFVRFYLEHAREYVPETGYIPLQPEAYARHLETMNQIEREVAVAAAAQEAP
jgi:hypothetical protein